MSKFGKIIIGFNRFIGLFLSLLWIFICAILPLYFFSTSGYQIFLSISNTSWPNVEGIVLFSFEENQRITYYYTVNDVEYHSQNVSYNLNDKDTLQRYPESSKVNVFYNPNNPRQAVLEQGFGYGFIPELLLGIIFCGLGWTALGWGFGRYKLNVDPVNWI